MIIRIDHPTEEKFYTLSIRRDPKSGEWSLGNQDYESMSFDDEHLFKMFDEFFRKYF